MAEPPPLPERPRLASWVQARMHVAGGASKVILHDPRSGQVMEIALEDWDALVCADGTRDLDGVVLACAKRGRQTREAEIVQLLRELDRAGVLVDGLDPPPAPPPVPAPATPAERPLEVLPDFRLRCDGRGSCCRSYGSVGFAPEEALRARLVAAEAEGPRLDPAHLFLPVTGAEASDPEEPLAVAQLDGRCFFLERGGGCGIHRRAGVEAKPFACRTYPATLVDDGVAVRVSVGPECACVFESVGAGEGERLVPEGARTFGDLDPRTGVRHLPAPVPLSARSTGTREALRSWSRALHDHARALEGDAAALAWGAARSLEERGFARAAFAPRPLAGVEARLEALRERARGAAEAEVGWRGASDLSRLVARWLADALAAAPGPLAPEDPEAERFYLAVLAFGHRLAVGGRPLAPGLRDRAARILAARAMARRERPDGVGAGPPIALLEAALRNLGITSAEGG